ncbi:MAG: DNA methyltransferase [Candidatus Hatepunaea meridiana]|nr:DNA methyltransferase [Candidatus Hatepunaea meridiana]
MNELFYGDNLDILKNSIEDCSIDLIYIDPPFNSKRSYNVLFESIDLSDTKAQKEAFADTWSNVAYLDEMCEIQDLDLDLYRILQTLDRVRVSKGAISYLTTMALRIYYMHKKLKSTGSFYLHCDTTMSHYLKMICDLIFGYKNFRNEISWERSHTRSSISKIYRRSHDVILFYSKSNKYRFNIQYLELSEASKKLYSKKDETGYYRTVPLLVSGTRNGETGKEWRGVNPSNYGKNGMHWVTLHKNLNKYVKDELIYWGKDGRKLPQLKYYLHQNPGVPSSDFWKDISNVQQIESLGYQTQKPEALLERIIKASSNEGDIIADFFCGCGTAVAVAQKLNRKWIGADISHLAIRLILDRLLKPYDNNRDKLNEIKNSIDINGFPKDIATAKDLAQKTKKGRFKFQDWIIEVMLGGVSKQVKVGDGGFDGYLTFYKTRKEKDLIIIEVKSGNVNVRNIREFINVVETENAGIGVFVCFEENVTKPMLLSAKKVGFYESDLFGQKYDKIQIITVEELLHGKSINYPPNTNVTFKKATMINSGNKDNLVKLFD